MTVNSQVTCSQWVFDVISIPYKLSFECDRYYFKLMDRDESCLRWHLKILVDDIDTPRAYAKTVTNVINFVRARLANEAKDRLRKADHPISPPLPRISSHSKLYNQQATSRDKRCSQRKPADAEDRATTPTLQEKFRQLVDHQQHKKVSKSVKSTSVCADHNGTIANKNSAQSSFRVSVIGDVLISADALSVLDLGPSFAPVQSISPEVSRKIVGGLQLVHDRLRLGAKEEERRQENRIAEQVSLPSIPFPRMMCKPPEPNPTVDNRFRVFATSVYSVSGRFSKKKHVNFNLSVAQRRGLREIHNLITAGEINVSVSDKGGEFVVLSRELDKAITRQHLEDDNLYVPSFANGFRKQYRRLNRI
ncbi:hypothetical protein RB195_023532 [Necator americanus]|uniref:Uncharacterized protein n=1 Tax=Necator americanus TaxID=51031 RepID=A0ABR1EJJ7_NECAM